MSNKHVYLRTKDRIISPFHNIDLRKGDNFQMIVEIPRGTTAKMEISTSEPMNPIKQDVKNGKLRFVHTPYPCNYGAFPQTWEDPTHKDPGTGYYGDGDPLDISEIGDNVGSLGQIKIVKILGILGLIDNDETDWKVIAIDISDPKASMMNDIGDVDPLKLKEIFEWFRDYKIPDGKPPNKFFKNGEYLPKSFALKIINETHQSWKDLISGKIPKQGKRGNGEDYKVSVC